LVFPGFYFVNSFDLCIIDQPVCKQGSVFLRAKHIPFRINGLFRFLSRVVILIKEVMTDKNPKRTEPDPIFNKLEKGEENV